MKKLMDIYFSKQFVFFVLSGAIAAFLHWTSRIALGKWLQFTWSVAIAYIIGMSVAFLLNKFLVFIYFYLVKLISFGSLN